MKTLGFVILFIVVVMIAGCADSESDQSNIHTDPANEETDNHGQESQEENDSDEHEQNQTADDLSSTPEVLADGIIKMLHEFDMDSLSAYVHKTKGVRFTPYAHIDVESDQVFTAEEFTALDTDPTVYHWGLYDGSGDPIELTFSDYYDRFVYDHEYINAEDKSVNESLAHGNSIDNSADVYPEATIVEYYFSGFEPNYEGMDWRALRVVLEEEGGTWYLVGIIHDEWTI